MAPDKSRQALRLLEEEPKPVLPAASHCPGTIGYSPRPQIFPWRINISAGLITLKVPGQLALTCILS